MTYFYFSELYDYTFRYLLVTSVEKFSNLDEKPKIGQALGLESAEMACKTFGKEWKITRRTPGSAVCSTVPSLQNCHGCESWRLLVWEDGACDRLVPSKCRFDTTKSGNYYCGYNPCTGGNLVQGGLWGQFGAHPNN